MTTNTSVVQEIINGFQALYKNMKHKEKRICSFAVGRNYIYKIQRWFLYPHQVQFLCNSRLSL